MKETKPPVKKTRVSFVCFNIRMKNFRLNKICQKFVHKQHFGFETTRFALAIFYTQSFIMQPLHID